MSQVNDTRSLIWRAVIAISVAVLVFFFFFYAFAHDHERPELNAWFSHLKSKISLCCDGTEAVHLKDIEWQTQDKPNSHFRVMIPVDAEAYAKSLKGEQVPMTWVDVPDDAVVDEPNKEGSALVWPMYMQWNVPGIRCFMPGSMS